MPLLEIKTTKITGKGQIAIPKDMRQTEGFKEGMRIAVLAFEDHIELRPLTEIRNLEALKISSTAILSEKSLSKDWGKKEEDEAWKNL